MNSKQLLRGGTLLAAILLLAACGGGGSDSSSGTSASSLSGVAAVGSPIVGGAIKVVCAAGSAVTTSTGSAGAYTVSLTGQTLPCAVQVTGGTVGGSNNTQTLHSVATAAGTANVTPLTDLLVANLSGQSPATWFTAISGSPASLTTAVTASSVSTALSTLRTALSSSLTPLATINPLTDSFTPEEGDEMDDMLTAIGNAGDYADLLAAAEASDFSSVTSALSSAWENTATATATSVATVNATSTTDWVYYDLVNKQVVSEPSGSNWQIAFKRYDVKLNSGDGSTGGAVGGFVGYTSSTLYPSGTASASALIAATADSTLADLTTTSMSLPTSASKWVKDTFGSSLNPAYTGSYPGALDYGWYYYCPTTTSSGCSTSVSVAHQIYAHSDNAAIVKSGEGSSYARVSLSSITYADTSSASSQQTWTFNFDVQASGASSFTNSAATWTVDLPASGVSVCYDFDAKTQVSDCSGTAWDLKLKSGGLTGSLYTNSGVSGSGAGGTLGGPSTTYASLTEASSQDSHAWLADSMSNVFTGTNAIGSAVFEYGLGGDTDHYLYPSYRVFLITTDNSKAYTVSNADGTKVYALQVIGYYGGSAGTTSGYVKFRWKKRTD